MKDTSNVTVLYIACMQAAEVRTQKELSVAAGLTEVTIRNLYSELRKIVPKSIIIMRR